MYQSTYVLLLRLYTPSELPPHNSQLESLSDFIFAIFSTEISQTLHTYSKPFKHTVLSTLLAIHALSASALGILASVDGRSGGCRRLGKNASLKDLRLRVVRTKCTDRCLSLVREDVGSQRSSGLLSPNSTKEVGSSDGERNGQRNFRRKWGSLVTLLASPTTCMRG